MRESAKANKLHVNKAFIHSIIREHLCVTPIDHSHDPMLPHDIIKLRLLFILWLLSLSTSNES